MTDIQILKHHRSVWKQKPLLRALYAKWYRKIIDELSNVPGKTVELGAGGGNFKEFYPCAIATDIVKCPWLDMWFDAHHMPFAKNTVSNIVMIDVLHHLADPVGFFHEAYRVLHKGGRIVLLEPFPSLFSLPLYRAFHPEPFIFSIDYFQHHGQHTKSAWDSNQAIPYLLLYKQRRQFEREFREQLEIIKREELSFLLYPLSGGFENPQHLPGLLIPAIALLERLLYPFRYILAFRTFIVIEKL